MLKSCQYCGKIHDSKHICFPKKEQMRERQSKGNRRTDQFRWSRQWKEKSKEIRQRDLVCQICLRNRYNPLRKYETNGLSVHHIDGIEEAWDRRMDNGNLITLCEYHHEMAEKGEISKKELFRIAEEQEGIPPGDPESLPNVSCTPTPHLSL